MIVSKYHGCGNDFIITRVEEVKEDHASFAKRICNRHTGIGADGLILVKQQPLEMIFYNCDGSRAPMCGNGIRCFARYVLDEGICLQDQYPVETLAGVMEVKVLNRDPYLVEICMGSVQLDPELLHLTTKEVIWEKPVTIDKETFLIDTCFMGTIHTMVVVDDAFDPRHANIGKQLHQHSLFKEKTNVNFVQIIDRKTINVQTYERGVGMTYACGTGCCASVWDANKKGLVDTNVHVNLPYGFLDIRMEEDVIYMSGPAICIMKGAYII